MIYIDYIVVAPESNELDDITVELTNRNRNNILNGLQNIGPYGERRHDWKAFNNKSIETFIDENSARFGSKIKLVHQTNLFNDVYEDRPEEIDQYKIYFIDLLSIYHPNLRQFLREQDASFSKDAAHVKCCFIFSDLLSNGEAKDVNDDINQYRLFRRAFSSYDRGNLHKFAYNERDLQNFIAYIVNGISGLPKPTSPNVYDRHYEKKPAPKLNPDASN